MNQRQSDFHELFRDYAAALVRGQIAQKTVDHVRASGSYHFHGCPVCGEDRRVGDIHCDCDGNYEKPCYSCNRRTK